MSESSIPFDFDNPEEFLAAIDGLKRRVEISDADPRTDEQIAAHVGGLLENVLNAVWYGNDEDMQRAAQGYTEARNHPSADRLLVDVDEVRKGDFISVTGVAEDGGPKPAIGVVEHIRFTMREETGGFEFTIRPVGPAGGQQDARVVWVPDDEDHRALRLPTPIDRVQVHRN